MMTWLVVLVIADHNAQTRREEDTSFAILCDYAVVATRWL
jgi:hypothetical protein